MNLHPTRPKAAAAIVIFAALIPISFAQDAPQDTAPTPQQQAEALLTRARKLSDIRALGAPAFHLKATFTINGPDLDKIEGAYDETWISNSQWRRETTVKDWRRIEVAGVQNRWVLDNIKDFPDRAARMPEVMQVLPSTAIKFDFESVAEDREEKPAADCAVTRPNQERQKSAFCFEKKSGVLLDRISTVIRPHNVVAYHCIYGSFRRVGSYWFPREAACFEDHHLVLEVKVVDLAPAQATDTAFFAPPNGAKEASKCTSSIVPPVPTFRPPPDVAFFRSNGRDILLNVLVDPGGKPARITVLSSGGEFADESAIKTVRAWRFKPATCDSEPVESDTLIELRFQ